MNYGRVEEQSSSRSRSPSTARRAATSAILTDILSRSDRAPTSRTVDARPGKRDFGGETAIGPKAAVVNRAFAERLFGSKNPIGQQVTGGGVTYQIVGVVGNVKTTSLGEELTPVLYRSIEQNVGTEPNLLGYT